jgi:hypothetical protein
MDRLERKPKKNGEALGLMQQLGVAPEVAKTKAAAR